MAVSKNTRKTVSDTNQRTQKLFRNSMASSDGREQEWREAVQHAGTGNPPLRFPVYEYLYFINIYSQRLVDLIREVNGKFSICLSDSLYYEFLIQQVRAGATSDILEHMNGVELTEDWLFSALRKEEEKKLREPDDVYFDVRKREEERMKQGLAPRIRFLDQKPAAKAGSILAKKSN